MPTAIGLAGQKFDNFTVGSFSGKRRGKEMLWTCYCNCGKDFDATETEIIDKQVVSCGCKKKQQIQFQKLADNSSALSCGNFVGKKKPFFCQIRGCPTCEEKLNETRVLSVERFLDYYKSCTYWLLHLPCPSFDVEEFRQGIIYCHATFQRLVQLKETKIEGFVRFTKVDWLENEYDPSLTIHALIATPLSTVSGYSVDWASIWQAGIREEADMPTIERYNSIDQIKDLARVDLSFVPNSKAVLFRQQIAKLHLFSTSNY